MQYTPLTTNLCPSSASSNHINLVLYTSNDGTKLSQTFTFYTRVFAQRILQISLKQLIWYTDITV